MKKLLLILFLLLGSMQIIFAQRPSERRKQSLQNHIKNEDDPYFAVNEVPEAYNNESAVVLAQHTGYMFTSKKGSLIVTETNRRKIMLLDKAAVNAFSEFYYQSAPGYAIALSIEKPDGKKIAVSSEDAVKVTTAVPEVYRTYYNSDTWEYYKIAVPNLEPGDILDYYTKVTESKENNRMGAQCFSPVMYQLHTNYTILKQKIDFKIEKGFYVNMKSSNGAPELVLEEESAADRKNNMYTISDGVRPKVSSSLWVYKNLELPNIKFQVCFNQIGKEDKAYQFLAKPNEVKDAVTPEEIVARVNYRFDNSALVDQYVYNTVSFMKENYKKETDPIKYAKAAFYYLRHILLVNPENDQLKDVERIRDDIFTIMLMKVLDRKDIKYDLLVGMPRGFGKIDDVVLYDELTWFLKIGDTYVYNPGKNSTFSEPDFTLQNTKAYQISIATNKKLQGFKEVIIPSSAYQDNSLQANLQVNLSNTMESMDIKANYEVKGLYKQTFADNALGYMDLAENDHLSFGGKKVNKETTRNKVKLAEQERKAQVAKAETEKNTKKAMQELLELDFKNIIAYKQFTLEKDGRSEEQNVLAFSESYEVGNLVKKAGANYIVEVGALIGSQVEILEENKDRNYDINMAFPKLMKHQIVINIPAGYRVEGLNDLSIQVDNASGAFKSSTRMEGDKLIIDTEKIYKKEYVKKENWNEMVEFLDAAYTFTQKKVILKQAI